MQIHELKVKGKKKRKTIGRGGKRGTYSGRGNKGQKARSGGNVNPLFEGGRSSLVERMKKLRGFKSIALKKNNFNLGDLEKNFQVGEIVNSENFLKKGMLSKTQLKAGIKILSDGDLTKKLTVSGKDISLSQKAKEIIEKLGGKIEF